MGRYYGVHQKGLGEVLWYYKKACSHPSQSIFAADGQRHRHRLQGKNVDARVVADVVDVVVVAASFAAVVVDYAANYITVVDTADVFCVDVADDVASVFRRCFYIGLAFWAFLGRLF